MIVHNKILTFHNKCRLFVIKSWPFIINSGLLASMAFHSIPRIFSFHENQVCPLAVLITYISSVSLKFRTCYIMGQWGEFRVKNASLCFAITFRPFLFVFHQKMCTLVIFIYFFDKWSNLRKKILTSQKP